MKRVWIVMVIDKLRGTTSVSSEAYVNLDEAIKFVLSRGDHPVRIGSNLIFEAGNNSLNLYKITDVVVK